MWIDAQFLLGVGTLAAVVEEKSFTRAANALGLSAASVRCAIARLESKVGVCLIDRTTRSVILTTERRHLYDRVLLHLAGLEEAATAVSVAFSGAKSSLGKF